MSTLATRKEQTFAEQIRAANHRVQSNFSTKKRLTKKDLDAIKTCFLDYYEIYMLAKRSVPKPELLDESGLLVEILEDCEQRFQSALTSHDTQVVEWSLNWIEVLQELRWLIMINDGLVDKPNADNQIYTNVDELMASLDKE
ncbi:MAG: hypothetical protein OXF39_01640 [Nitrospira sp.]|nr:hypothetical protein [Nitrospira sp.]